MKASDRCIELIKQFEGFRSEPYDDIAGKATIGYGHLIRANERFTKLTETEATKLLCEDLRNAEACIEKHVDVELSQNQFDALCSFVYNVGANAFYNSTMRRYINKSEFAEAGEEFLRWHYARGVSSKGLLNRRIKERELWEA